MSKSAPETVSKPELRPSKSAVLSRDFSACGPQRVRITLPTGIAAGIETIRDVWVEPLTGKNEVWAERVGVDSSLPEWVSGLIGSNVFTVTEGNIPLGSLASEMSVSDRDVVMLCLRMLTFGPEIWSVARCPHPGCGKMMDVTFDLLTLMPAESRDRAPIYPVSVCYGDEVYELNCREPNGTDQEAICKIIRSSPRKALLELISRCIVSFNGRSNIAPEVLGKLPEELIDEMQKAMADSMVSLDWGVKLECPECGKSFISNLDLHAYFWQELMFSMDDFWSEVHTLALNYHWSEDDILSLTRWRRKMYLNHIEKHLTSRTN